MGNEQMAPETKGVAMEVLATVDLAGEIEGMEGRQLRMRLVTVEPGGVFGPIHDHKGRPGTVYILQGTITDHRDGVATDYGAQTPTTPSMWCLMSMCSRNGMRVPHVICSRNLIPEGEGLVFGGEDEGLLDPVDVPGQVGRVGLGVEQL